LKNFPEFSDKKYNLYNKAPQKCLEFFDKFGLVKDYQNAKRIK